jgi:hypothetical protein
MRALCAVLIFSLGCASTVTRLDGDFPTTAGPAKTVCEQQDWLLVAPTRVELVDKKTKRSEQRDDGVAWYRIGARSPESIPVIGKDPLLRPVSYDERDDLVRRHDRRQYIAAGLGTAGLVAIAIGTVLFVSAFKDETVTRNGVRDEQHSIDGTLAPVGGTLILAGFGLGIAGIAVNPGQADRSRAEASRYVFLPPRERPEYVVELTGKHNQAVRTRCGAPTP